MGRSQYQARRARTPAWTDPLAPFRCSVPVARDDVAALVALLAVVMHGFSAVPGTGAAVAATPSLETLLARRRIRRAVQERFRARHQRRGLHAAHVGTARRARAVARAAHARRDVVHVARRRAGVVDSSERSLDRWTAGRRRRRPLQRSAARERRRSGCAAATASAPSRRERALQPRHDLPQHELSVPRAAVSRSANMWAPARMNETYVDRIDGREREKITCVARYSNFRRFETSARIIPRRRRRCRSRALRSRHS